MIAFLNVELKKNLRKEGFFAHVLCFQSFLKLLEIVISMIMSNETAVSQFVWIQ